MDRRNDSEDSPLLTGGLAGAADAEEERRDEQWTGQFDFEGLPWWRTPSVFWLLPPSFLFALATGGTVVPKLNLILSLICNEYFSDKAADDPSFTFIPVTMGEDNPQCRTPEVSARTSQFMLLCSLVSGCLSAIVSPKLGALSDRYGRVPVLMYCAVGMFVMDMLFLYAARYPHSFHVTWLLLGHFFEGMSGSFITSTAITNSYATDCTAPHRRGIVFAYFYGCLWSGVALGPLITAYIIEWTGTVVIMFCIALAIHVSFFFFLAAVVPESLSKRRQMKARETHRAEQDEQGPPATDWPNQLRGINPLAPLKILWPTGADAKPAVRRNLVLLAATDTITFGLGMGANTVVILYTNYKFGWGNFESSRFVSITNTCRVLSLMVLLPLLTRLQRRRSGKRAAAAAAPSKTTPGSDAFDLAIIRTAVFLDTLGLIGYSVARGGALFTVSGAIAAAGSIGSPTTQAALTKHVPAERVGQLLGASALLHALARIVAPVAFNGVYAATVGRFDQAVFVCLAVSFGAAFACACFVRPHGELAFHPTSFLFLLFSSLSQLLRVCSAVLGGCGTDPGLMRVN